MGAEFTDTRDRRPGGEVSALVAPFPVALDSTEDYALEVALGNKAGISSFTATGQSIDCDNGILTDIWDGADGVTADAILVLPTVARIHDIASVSANDTSAGTGARTVLVTGLVDWDTASSSELVTMNGVSNVATANSYIVITSLITQTFGSQETNDGVITATAQTDATVSAAILAGNGKSLMAVVAVPSTQRLALTQFSSDLFRDGGSGTAKVTISLILKLNADQPDSGFVLTGQAQISDAVLSSVSLQNPDIVAGPALLKMQALSDTNNVAVLGSMSGYLVDN